MAFQFGTPGATAPSPFGAPKAPAAAPFGSPQPAAPFGFGSPKAAPAFGAAPAPAFGAAPTAPAFGAQPQAQAAPQAPAVNPWNAAAPGAGRGGAGIAAQYLLQWDSVYDSTHPECKFRAFFYNFCTPGQCDQAVNRERLTFQQYRGAPSMAQAGPSEEQWIMAKRDNPDPENTYPYPVHFMRGIKSRAEKQKEQFAAFHQQADILTDAVSEIRALQDENNQLHKRLVLEQAMIERKLLSAMARAEVLRQHGIKVGPEKQTILAKCQAMALALRTPTRFAGQVRSLEAMRDASLASGGSSSVDPAAESLAHSVDADTLRDWSKFLGKMDAGIAKLQMTVEKDLADIKALKQRGSSGRDDDQ